MGWKYNPLAPDAPQHGTRGGYSNYKCRCDACKAAQAAYTKRQRENRRPPASNDPRHGTNNSYVNHNCRCAACTEAHRAYQTAG